MTDTPAAKPDDASAVDPGAIDLDVLKTRYDEARQECKKDPWCPWAGEDLVDLMATEFPALIAAVEALRAREKQTLVMIADMLDGEMKLSRRAEAAEACVVEWKEKTWEMQNKFMEAADSAEAAEALVMELTRALRDIGQSGPVDIEGNYDPDAGWLWCYDRANAARSVTPAEVLERARAVEEVIEKVRSIIRWAPHKNSPSQFDFQHLVDALAKLDALGKEE